MPTTRKGDPIVPKGLAEAAKLVKWRRRKRKEGERGGKHSDVEVGPSAPPPSSPGPPKPLAERDGGATEPTTKGEVYGAVPKRRAPKWEH